MDEQVPKELLEATEIEEANEDTIPPSVAILQTAAQATQGSSHQSKLLLTYFFPLFHSMCSSISKLFFFFLSLASFSTSRTI